MFLALLFQEVVDALEGDAKVEALGAHQAGKVDCHQFAVAVDHRATAGALQHGDGVHHPVAVGLLRHIAGGELGLDALLRGGQLHTVVIADEHKRLVQRQFLTLILAGTEDVVFVLRCAEDVRP